jgi:hypothetical protein
MTKPILLFALLCAAGCASPRPVAAPAAFDDGPPLVGLIETPGVAAPVTELPEARRREWIEAHRPKVEPVRVERVVVREVEPVRYVRTHDHCDWSLPFWWSVGWWGGHRRHGRHGHGWSWGLGVGDRWCW